MTKFICDHPWTHFEVNNPNGDVTMCCDNNTVLGNINDQSIEETWNGEGYQNIRKRMRDDGAHSMCPHNCPVLNGFKTYQNLNWHDGMAETSPARQNAAKNDTEFGQGLLKLESNPRWMRYTYSYLCNLDCYHCYQREDAIAKVQVPDSFMKEVYDLAPYYQVLYFFGGEPFLYRPVLKMMEDIKIDPDCRFHCVTNATLLTDRIRKSLEKVKIGHFAISLDAAAEQSFDTLRRRGTVATWDDVMSNVAQFSEMKKDKGFTFTASMTLNSVNHDEIEKFADLCIGFEAEPLIILVSNPYQTYAFQKSFLTFTEEQFDTIEKQIKRALPKVEKLHYQEAVMALKSLQRTVREHRKGENHAWVFLAKKYMRRVFHMLPYRPQIMIRKILQ